MSNSLGPIPDNSQQKQKILSTENSRNSTFTHFHENKEKSCDEDNFRLFTFMNVKNQQKGPNNNIRKKSSKRISNKCLKKDSSGLINIIEQSRKKRQNFYKLILDSESLTTIQNQRKCKTPTGMRQSNNNVSVKCFNSKKSHTPRASVNREFSFNPKENKLHKKLLDLKNTNSELRISLNKRQQSKPIMARAQKQGNKPQRLQKEDQTILLKKKRDLQKQLLQINQTLLLGHQKKRQKVPKTKR